MRQHNEEYKVKQFRTIEECVQWLNTLTGKGEFVYSVVSVWQCEDSICVMLYGHGEDWGEV